MDSHAVAGQEKRLRVGGDKAIPAVFRKRRAILRAQLDSPLRKSTLAAGWSINDRGAWVRHGSE